jgi:nitrate/TMAO reductase-like tetraheme cytochrome c subunit
VLAFVILFNNSLFSKNITKVSQISQPDQCMSCHKDMSDIDHSHPNSVFGCASCHGGNKFARDKVSAHKGIVLNPARLEHASLFCVKCHKDIISRVSNSMMQSQSGILNVLKYQWGETNELNSTLSLQELKNDTNISFATSHFRKLCAACHINQDEKVFPHAKMTRGGGCSDCHRVSKTDKNIHAKFTSKIPTQNCVKCHNRSNRIGLSYQGIFESEGYGTPYIHGDLSHKLRDGDRFFYNLAQDLHHSDANMSCIDCHSEKGVMGDGKKHYHMEEAEDIKCKDCHEPKFKKANSLAITLSHLNKDVPLPKKIAYSKKLNSPLYNVQKDGNKTNFYRKSDGKKFDLKKMSNKAYHTLRIHKRLDCSACHASWAPSCYGCHEVYYENGKQYDWVSKTYTKGQWQELRSFLRFETPSLGIGYNKKIMPFAPGCQVIGTNFKSERIENFHSMAMAGWDPHTTQKTSRTCVDCHFNPASLGLGRGNLDIKDNNITFTPIYNSKQSGMPFSYPIDAFVSPQGKQFQSTSRKEARSFNKNELEKIVSAYKCILCHDKYEDKIYFDFNLSKKLFYKGVTPCLK